MYQVHWKFSKKQLFHVSSICCASQTCNNMGGMWKVKIIGPISPGKTIRKLSVHEGYGPEWDKFTGPHLPHREMVELPSLEMLKNRVGVALVDMI